MALENLICSSSSWVGTSWQGSGTTGQTNPHIAANDGDAGIYPSLDSIAINGLPITQNPVLSNAENNVESPYAYDPYSNYGLSPWPNGYSNHPGLQGRVPSGFELIIEPVNSWQRVSTMDISISGWPGDHLVYGEGYFDDVPNYPGHTIPLGVFTNNYTGASQLDAMMDDRVKKFNDRRLIKRQTYVSAPFTVTNGDWGMFDNSGYFWSTIGNQFIRTSPLNPSIKYWRPRHYRNNNPSSFGAPNELTSDSIPVFFGSIDCPEGVNCADPSVLDEWGTTSNLSGWGSTGVQAGFFGVQYGIYSTTVSGFLPYTYHSFNYDPTGLSYIGQYPSVYGNNGQWPVNIDVDIREKWPVEVELVVAQNTIGMDADGLGLPGNKVRVVVYLWARNNYPYSPSDNQEIASSVTIPQDTALKIDFKGSAKDEPGGGM